MSCVVALAIADEFEHKGDHLSGDAELPEGAVRASVGAGLCEGPDTKCVAQRVHAPRDVVHKRDVKYACGKAAEHDGPQDQLRIDLSGHHEGQLDQHRDQQRSEVAEGDDLAVVLSALLKLSVVQEALVEFLLGCP